ncbi:solute carrier organic anion transporter family member 2A1-like [Saccoglossus kowalevskii]
MMWGFGPIIGFIIAAGCTSVFVDINRVNMETVYLKLGDPQWIGAWWLGGAFLIPPMVICALTFWFVPKDLKKYRLKPITRKTNTNYKKDEQADKDEESLKNVQATGSGFIRSLKDFPRTLCRLVLNPYFILVTVAFAFDLGVAMGILMFLPKYLEVQFNLSSIAANATTALACTAPYGIGTFLGGYAINRFKLGEFGIAKFLVVIVGTSIIFCAMMFPFGCNSVDINGVSEMGGKNTLPCNENCHCSIGVYRPVCGSNGETYMSPCYAGCTQMNDNGSYIDCSCIKSNDTEDMHAMDGACQEGQTCPSFYIFAVILFLFAITSGAREIPAVMLTIRSVKETDKSFALAINFLLVRCLGEYDITLAWHIRVRRYKRG